MLGCCVNSTHLLKRVFVLEIHLVDLKLHFHEVEESQQAQQKRWVLHHPEFSMTSLSK